MPALQAQAVTTLDDGSTLTRSASADGTDEIVLFNASSAVINTGGSAINTGTQPGRDGIFGTGGSNVEVAGGTVKGRDTNNGGSGVGINGGVFEFSAGTITGGDSIINGNGGRGATITGTNLFTMTGGTLTGGNGSTGGVGLGIFDTAVGTISGGTVAGGIGQSGSMAYSLRISAMANLTVSGGTFGGDFFLSDNASLTVRGYDLVFDRGTRSLSGFLEDGNAIDLLLFKAPDAFLTLVNAPPPAVPLPAGGILLLSGFGVAALFGRKRKRAT
ncbi:VPLPA-CTERM sorting domain-containing protein [Tateyamaria armeniaca]|uniref:VPLPA-CTERM sorting domain-containing protein n=1 Tax=Tateyamaria armeniaca TaxID=2518930 RepID=A0ABW8UQY1_9RHOB